MRIVDVRVQHLFHGEAERAVNRERAVASRMTKDEMTEPQKAAEKQNVQTQGATTAAPQPQWAKGLKQLYNSVVDEPLPDSFKDLLAKLDDDGK
ncbi:conserved hypothetical protein [Altererythrobacter sp. B11]|uniref:NepR family anti-sigma factor n=1 Tax=Altererythrobacter sp. B11 TaxID=2060312 RepID=UPI000DC722C2|nr:NepR family anti-sigma factor [Altererythrobacter sp. B11]BBC74389.1 conserved hypothetical protein [Altererythrobacter sp. B11]